VPRLQRIAVIGCAACGGSAEFSEIADVAVTTSGVVWIADRDDPRIRTFTLKGVSLRSFGRKGRGPGEFAGIERLLPATDGTVSIVDMLAQRVTRVDSLGKVVASASIDGFPLDADAPMGSRDIHVLHSRFRPGTSSIARLDALHGRWRTVLGPFTDFPRVDAPREVRSLAVAPDGTIAVAEGESEYRIRTYSTTGVSRDVTRNVPRKQRTPAEMETLRSRIGRGGDMRASEGDRSGGSTGRGPADIPSLKVHLIWSALRYDTAGRLWVRTMRGDETKTIFDLFDQSLSYVGEVTVSGDVTRYAFRDGYLVTAALSVDGFAQATVWRVTER
jgi:hypothetical protein